ncbi:MAG: hypothetical protein JWN68_1768 [Nocardioides sp.]|uniref:hypothetical protein n=1 Tax=Nocardioides sp. TaxID=35761 RepID=UPI002604420F|nr:hypothetical protein [Nocardioides sp.]MCW2833815.1 hypothetical protein [Nocardioides sp.]
MDNEQIIWIVVIALAALVLIGLIVAAMRKKSLEAKRSKAHELRQEAAGNAATLPDAHARAEQTAVEAERKRFEAERAEHEAQAARTAVEQERARHEDQIRAADRLDPDVDHKAKDYAPQATDPVGPSNVPTDPTYADPSTGRAVSTGTGTSTSASSDPDTVFDSDDRQRTDAATTDGTTNTDGGTHRA